MKRLLVANRGEIAVRILSAAKELNICAIAIFAGNDTDHISHANEAYELSSATSFSHVEEIVSICKKNSIDAVHPGYGFLSESPEFAAHLDNARVQYIGPGADILKITGDKGLARGLAEECQVPVLPALEHAAKEPSTVLSFAARVGYPIMLKAVDGGGGRGIRLVRTSEELPSAFERAQAESASKSILAEKAVGEGWRHVEVQILGDGQNVRHFWDRECSLQRRFQKVIEISPSTISAALRTKIISSALSIAKKLHYKSLGTFEFLASPEKNEYYFIEVNPRLQVEHTITETITSTDLVYLQLQVAAGRSITELGLDIPDASHDPPHAVAMQFRLTAEDPRADFALSMGKINRVTWPGGNGLRIDTHVSQGTIISTDFDSLLAKVIVYGSDYNMVLRKGLRALNDVTVDGVTTNLDLLTGILLSEDYKAGKCDIQWLEANLRSAVEAGSAYRRGQRLPDVALQLRSTPLQSEAKAGRMSIKKGDSWSISLTNAQRTDDASLQNIRIIKVMRDDFPNSLTAEVSFSSAGSSHADSSSILNITQASAGNIADGFKQQRRGNSTAPEHLVCPLSGQLVETLVSDGDEVEEYEPVAIIRQMKMELEIRAHRSGCIRALWDAEEGEDIVAGTLVCEIIGAHKPREKL